MDERPLYHGRRIRSIQEEDLHFIQYTGALVITCPPIAVECGSLSFSRYVLVACPGRLSHAG